MIFRCTDFKIIPNYQDIGHRESHACGHTFHAFFHTYETEREYPKHPDSHAAGRKEGPTQPVGWWWQWWQERGREGTETGQTQTGHFEHECEMSSETELLEGE